MGQTTETTESQESESVLHVLGCNRAHAHLPPDCCSRSCWCQDMPWGEIKEVVRKIEHAGRHEADFSDEKITNFADQVVSLLLEDEEPWPDIERIVRDIEHAARHKADFSDRKVTSFAKMVIDELKKHE